MYRRLSGDRRVRSVAIAASVGLHCVLLIVLREQRWPDPQALSAARPIEVWLTADILPAAEPESIAEEPPPTIEAEPQDETDAEDPAEIEPVSADSPKPVTDDSTPAIEFDPDSDAAGGGDSELDPLPDERAQPIDWAAEIRNSVRFMREEQERNAAYLTFGFPVAPEGTTTRNLAREVEPRTGRPGPESALPPVGPLNERFEAGDSCVEAIGRGSILVEDAHRFSNAMTSCWRSQPAEPRSDLFEEQKPDYLK